MGEEKREKGSATVLPALLACGASLFLLMFRSLPFSGSPSGKLGFSFRKPLPTGHSKISKCLKCAPVQAGTLPRGAKGAETHACDLPPRPSTAPPGTPRNHHFSVPLSPKAQGNLRAPSLDPRRATWSPHGAPKLPNGSQNDPKWTPKRVPKGPQNAKHIM